MFVCCRNVDNLLTVVLTGGGQDVNMLECTGVDRGDREVQCPAPDKAAGHCLESDKCYLFFGTTVAMSEASHTSSPLTKALPSN